MIQILGTTGTTAAILWPGMAAPHKAGQQVAGLAYWGRELWLGKPDKGVGKG